MSEKEMLKSLGYGDEQSLDDIVYDDNATAEFVQKHNDLLEKVRQEARDSFESLDETSKAELEKKGLKYDEIEAFAKEVGANKITDGLVSKFESMTKTQGDLVKSKDSFKTLETRLKALEKEFKEKSITADVQKKAGAGEVETGGQPQPEEKTLGERLIPYAKALRG